MGTAIIWVGGLLPVILFNGNSFATSANLADALYWASFWVHCALQSDPSITCHIGVQKKITYDRQRGLKVRSLVLLLLLQSHTTACRVINTFINLKDYAAIRWQRIWSFYTRTIEKVENGCLPRVYMHVSPSTKTRHPLQAAPPLCVLPPMALNQTVWMYINVTKNGFLGSSFLRWEMLSALINLPLTQMGLYCAKFGRFNFKQSASARGSHKNEP